jgi:hypothetical protein
MPILLDMKPARDRWEGQVYNSQDGNTYSASIKLVNPDTLRLEGCVLSIFCGSQSWTRVPSQVRPGQADVRSAPPATAPRPPQSDGRSGQANVRPPASGQPYASTQPTQPTQDFCSSVVGVAGGPHESGLKQNGRR